MGLVAPAIVGLKSPLHVELAVSPCRAKGRMLGEGGWHVKARSVLGPSRLVENDSPSKHQQQH